MPATVAPTTVASTQTVTESSAETDEAGAVTIRVMDYYTKGQWGRAWDELHPSQRELISRDAFIECVSSSLAGVSITNATVVEVYEEDWLIPGTRENVVATAVTASYLVNGQPDIATFHEVQFEDIWYWILPVPDECE